MKRLASLASLLLALMMVAGACTSSEPTSTDDDKSTTTKGDDDTTDTKEGDTKEASGGDIECQEGSLNIVGSSTVEPISSNVADKYEEECSDASITVSGKGTSDGFGVFCTGDADINDASSAIKDEFKEECEANGVEYIELTIALDGIAVMTNPNNEVSCLAFADLYALVGDQSDGFENWSDASDLGTTLGSDQVPYPDAPLEISAPGEESGTYESFIDIVLKPMAKDNGGEEPYIRDDYSGQADDNQIITGITGSDSSFGWVGFAFAEANKDDVKVLEISEEVGGDCVAPSAETINDGSYPVSRPLYIYVNKAKVKENPLLAAYVDYYLNGAYPDSIVNAIDEGQGYIELGTIDETRAAWEEVK